MFDAFAVLLRESAELILILSAVAACLRSAKADHLLPLMRFGIAGGCIAGALLSFSLIASDMDPRWIAGLTFVFALGILLMVSTMLLTANTIRSRTEALVEGWLERGSAPLIICLFSLAIAFRESLEIGLFLRSQWLRTSGVEVVAGGMLGAAAVVCLCIVSRKISAHVGMGALFRVSALLLALLTIQMMFEALAEFVQASATTEHGMSLLAFIQPVLPNGRWYGWICAALMSISTALVLRSWWRESSG